MSILQRLDSEQVHLALPNISYAYEIPVPHLLEAKPTTRDTPQMGKVLKHILCIDDESDILEITKLALETVGDFQVSTCNSGKEALATAAQIKPDLILLDVMMPGLDGPATFSQLKLQPTLAHVPFIFMTAKVQPKEVSTYVALGALGVIAKPFDPMLLSREIESLWENAPHKT